MSSSSITLNPELAIRVPHTGKTSLRGWPVILEAFRMAAESVLINKLRSFLTLIGIIIGVASVVVVGAFIKGMERYVTDNITSILGSNTFMVSKIMGVDISEEEWERKMRTHKDINSTDFETVAKKSTLARVVAAERGGRSDVFYKDREVLDTRVTGATASIIQLSNIEVQTGRFFQTYEVDRSRYVAVIGWGVMNELFPYEDPVGKTVKLGGQPFEVIGVLAKRGSFLGNNMDNEAYVPITAFMKVFNWRRGWTLRIKTDPGENFQLAQDEVRTILRAKHGLRPSQEDDFDIMSTEEINRSVEDFSGAVAAVVTPVTMISLLVGAIVIMNIMLVSVTERTREIGIRKAIGARRRDVLMQFLLESGILGTLGGILGILLSYGICALLAAAFDFSLSISQGYIILSLTISGGIGILSGMYPAFKASRLDPIRALSYET